MKQTVIKGDADLHRCCLLIIFAGKKQDVWFVVDPETGEKQTSLTTSTSDSICPNSPLLYIGRTGTSAQVAAPSSRGWGLKVDGRHCLFFPEYVVTMFDTKTQELRWNATYNDYSAPPYDEKQDYSTSLHAQSVAECEYSCFARIIVTLHKCNSWLSIIVYFDTDSRLFFTCKQLVKMISDTSNTNLLPLVSL